MRFIYLLLACLMLYPYRTEAKPKLVMVTNATFPPYEYVAGQKIDGIDPAIVREVAESLGYELEIQDMSFDSVIAAVQSGKADIAASGITVTGEREKQVLFTVPYVISEQLIVVRKNSPVKTAKDLKEYPVGVQHGTTGDLYVSRNICEPERFSNGPLAIAALRTGKIAAVVIDGDPAQIFVRQNSDLQLLKEPLTSERYAFAIGKHNPKLQAEFNEELLKLMKSGRLKAIIEHYKSVSEKSAKKNTVSGKAPFLKKIRESIQINFVKDRRYLYLWKGFLTTIYITVLAAMIGIVIGFVVAVIRSMSEQTGKYRIADFFCRIYLTVIRGTPTVVQLLIIYFVIFGSVNISKVLVATIAFGINSGAYVAEIIRGGIMAIDRGQMEAGLSLGLNSGQTMRFVILPQAFKNVLPALGNEFIVLLKETSVSGYIALQDLTKGGDIIRSQTYDAFLPLIAVALIYLAVVMLLTKLLEMLERRLKRNE